MATRATFVLDRRGVVRWAVVNHPGEPSDPQDHVGALAEIG